MDYLALNTPIGELTIASDGNFITNLFFEGEAPEKIALKNGENPVLTKAATQLEEYFIGKRKVFDIPLKPKGGNFFQKVWETMRHSVPYGVTISYSRLAELSGNIKAARAVGMANNKNPIPIFIPCHRVLGKNGKLTGFRAGIDVKERLLSLEKSNS